MQPRDDLLVQYQDFYARYYKMKDRSLESFEYCCRYIDMVMTNARQDDKILEYGCGTGFNLRYFQENGYVNLWGTDSNEKMLVEARQAHNIKFKFPYELDEIEFDIIFTRAVLQEKNNSDEAVMGILNQFYDMLKDTGRVFTIEGRNVRNWVELFRICGFIMEWQGSGDFCIWSKV